MINKGPPKNSESPQMKRAPGRALSPKTEKLPIVKFVPDAAQAENRRLVFAIRRLNGARLQLGALDNLNFDLRLAEREFVAGVVYQEAEAAERCWNAVRTGLQRARILLATYRYRRRKTVREMERQELTGRIDPWAR